MRILHNGNVSTFKSRRDYARGHLNLNHQHKNHNHHHQNEEHPWNLNMPELELNNSSVSVAVVSLLAWIYFSLPSVVFYALLLTVYYPQISRYYEQTYESLMHNPNLQLPQCYRTLPQLFMHLKPVVCSVVQTLLELVVMLLCWLSQQAMLIKPSLNEANRQFLQWEQDQTLRMNVARDPAVLEPYKESYKDHKDHREKDHESAKKRHSGSRSDRSRARSNSAGTGTKSSHVWPFDTSDTPKYAILASASDRYAVDVAQHLMDEGSIDTATESSSSAADIKRSRSLFSSDSYPRDRNFPEALRRLRSVYKKRPS